MEPKYEFLEHVSDAYIAAYGRSLEEAFQNAALAMFEVMTDTHKIEQKIEDKISVDGWDEKALLYNWLEQLLLKFEIERKLYSKFDVSELIHADNEWKLRATAFGELFDTSKHEPRTEVKAVTYHQMEIGRRNGTYVLKFILDL
ncbi:archease [Candidatus Bathyarchaeota archaeon]|nr:archease [Candidatus Bathyarchaeota archaeon]